MACRSDASGLDNEDRKDENQEALWVVALRSWAAAKTSGLGYSLYYSGNRLGGAAYVNFMPFFLPTFRPNRSPSAENSTVEESGTQDQAAGSQIPDEPKAPEVAVQSVLVEVDQEHSVELNVPRREGPVLQGSSA